MGATTENSADSKETRNLICRGGRWALHKESNPSEQEKEKVAGGRQELVGEDSVRAARQVESTEGGVQWIEKPNRSGNGKITKIYVSCDQYV